MFNIYTVGIPIMVGLVVTAYYMKYQIEIHEWLYKIYLKIPLLGGIQKRKEIYRYVKEHGSYKEVRVRRGSKGNKVIHYTYDKGTKKVYTKIETKSGVIKGKDIEYSTKGKGNQKLKGLKKKQGYKAMSRQNTYNNPIPLFNKLDSNSPNAIQLAYKSNQKKEESKKKRDEKKRKKVIAQRKEQLGLTVIATRGKHKLPPKQRGTKEVNYLKVIK